ncbi:hypothetical protein BS50DRAFT_34014 [Corynespora cassiicola Philippines]|uniref:Uncharacterized protein n=1 Tax=Corynespora cassiicola Philippines TaxID=1448308 RepID=A0A2T2PBX5_CORCC|nr:hypothetical protein BS50DRAFT_34014 [Corynespora cassiicola Philippines]
MWRCTQKPSHRYIPSIGMSSLQIPRFTAESSSLNCEGRYAILVRGCTFLHRPLACSTAFVPNQSRPRRASMLQSDLSNSSHPLSSAHYVRYTCEGLSDAAQIHPEPRKCGENNMPRYDQHKHPKIDLQWLAMHWIREFNRPPSHDRGFHS